MLLGAFCIWEVLAPCVCRVCVAQVWALSAWFAGNSPVCTKKRLKFLECHYIGKMPVMLALVRQRSLHGYYACMVNWAKGALRG